MADAPAGFDDSYLPISAAEWMPELADNAYDVFRRNLSLFYSTVAGWPGGAREVNPLYDYTELVIPPTMGTVVASTAADSIQTLTPAGSYPGTDIFTLIWNTHHTANIQFGATTATVQTAIEALTGIGAGQIAVTGSTGGPWIVEFIGTLADAPQNPFTQGLSTAFDTVTITQTQIGHT